MQPAAHPSATAQNTSRRITVEPYGGVVTASLGSTVLASTKRALVLSEAGHQPVFYIPFEDIYFEHFARTDRRSHCPYKGDASYWMATANGEALDPAMWAYESPLPGMEAIARHGAFYEGGIRVEAGGSRAGMDENAQDQTHTPLG
ncbi:MAG TPA: DUF427 domain-containing protein [Mesorhizobium sp.]|jgi:uncharacterized protein (DUF427 family)|nr:DUF427 domain-containing protein [Mesorhizobium sp.]